MKEFLFALGLVVAFLVGAIVEYNSPDSRLICAQAVLHNDVAKCSVYIVKDVMR